jgi:hypothetical protein
VRNYSTINNYSIDPWFITGLFYAESSFVVTILKNPRYKTGWNVQARVQIKMHEIDRTLMEKIREFFSPYGLLPARTPPPRRTEGLTVRTPTVRTAPSPTDPSVRTEGWLDGRMVGGYRLYL